MEEKTLAGENLECHFRPKICILYGNQYCGSGSGTLKHSHAGILKYP